MSEGSLSSLYRKLLVSSKTLSTAGELDLLVLPLHNVQDAVYYSNILEGFCSMHEYARFWKTVEILSEQVFHITVECMLIDKMRIFPRDSLIFPAFLLDPVRSCMTPQFPETRLYAKDGSAALALRLSELLKWGNSTVQCDGSIFSYIGVNVAPTPLPILKVHDVVHWRSGDYLPRYMNDAIFAAEMVNISLNDIRSNYNVTPDQELQYHIIIAVDKLRYKDASLKESYGVSCIGSFCIVEPSPMASKMLTQIEKGVYKASFSSTDLDLSKAQIVIMQNSIQICEGPHTLGYETLDNFKVVDSITLNGSLFYITIISSPITPSQGLPSQKATLKLSIHPSEFFMPLMVENYMIQDCIEDTSSNITTVKYFLAYGYNNYLTKEYGLQLLRLPTDCVFQSENCMSINHLRLAIHLVICVILAIIAVFILPGYIFAKLVIIKKLKALASKKENETGIALCHHITRTPATALKNVVRKSQRIVVEHLDSKQKSINAAITGKYPTELKEISALLDVYPLNNQ